MRKKILPFVVACCCALTSFGQAEYCGKVVGGYIADWEDQSHVNYNQLTHAYFSFIGSKEDGSLCTYETLSGATEVSTGLPFEQRPEIMEKFNKYLAACTAAKTKKIISIGGYGCDKFMNLMVGNNKVATFVTNLMAFVDLYKLDGVDLDWEDVAPEHTANYAKVSQALRAATTAKSKLFITTVVMGWRAPNFPHADVAKSDFVQIMAYDMRGGTWAGDAAGNHSKIEDANAGISMWSGYIGAANKNKLVVGLPFYGYQQKNDVSNNNGKATKNWTYKAYVAAYPTQYDNDNYKVTATETIGLNGPTTIKAKTAIGFAAGGVMVWEMSNDLPYTDAKSLHLAIITKLKEAGLCPNGHGNTSSVKDIKASTVATGYYSASLNQVRVSLQKQGRVNVSLYNVLGQEVLSSDLGVVAAGDYGVDLNRSTIKAGVYIVTITVGNERVSSKIYID